MQIRVKPDVLRTVMQWSLMQNGWRALLFRTALLTALWLAVTFVFAAEIYLTTRGGPLKISWNIAAASAFHDWFPWILLSPIAVALAGRFRFDRTTWKRSLIVHLAACLVFTIAYEGLVALTYPDPFLYSSGGNIAGGVGIVSTTTVRPHDMTLTVSPGPFGMAPPPPSPGSNIVVYEQGHILSVGTGLLPPSAGSNFMFMAAGPIAMPLNAPTGALTSGMRFGPPPSPGTQFFHLTMMRSQFTFPIYWCIVCICWVFNHFQEAAERERRTLELEASLTQANLQTLKMQLQPHFLFNTLNVISSLIHENPKVADDMVGSLSQFLRATLDVSSKNEVPLREEFEFVDRYLEIQQARFGDRLRVNREVDSTLMGALVPPLILQPLVENALRHGIEPREGGGTVTMQALREGNVLRLEIADDGEGFSGSHLLRPGNGVGLANTEARLAALYGNHHQFKLTANQPAGARVTIEIPFHEAPSNIHNTV
jgi:hypothetical protein